MPPQTSDQPYWKQRRVASAVGAAFSTPSDDSLALHRIATWAIVAVGALTLLLALVFGNAATLVATAVIVLCMLQGLWRGAAEVAGFFVGLLIAAVLARPLGRAFEGLISSIAGTTGLTNRLVSMMVVAAVIVTATASIGGYLARKWMKDRHTLRAANRYLGAGIGIVEGCLLAFMLLWAPLTLEPIARAKDSAAPGQDANASRVLRWAEKVRGSALGGIADSTNPIAANPIFNLASDFSVVANDDAALTHFIESPAVQRLRDLPSLRQTIEKLEKDPQLAGIGEAKSVTPEMIMSMFNSPALLDAMDNTTILQDLRPAAAEIAQAIQDAKAKASGAGK